MLEKNYEIMEQIIYHITSRPKLVIVIGIIFFAIVLCTLEDFRRKHSKKKADINHKKITEFLQFKGLVLNATVKSFDIPAFEFLSIGDSRDREYFINGKFRNVELCLFKYSYAIYSR